MQLLENNIETEQQNLYDYICNANWSLSSLRLYFTKLNKNDCVQQTNMNRKSSNLKKICLYLIIKDDLFNCFVKIVWRKEKNVVEVDVVK